MQCAHRFNSLIRKHKSNIFRLPLIHIRSSNFSSKSDAQASASAEAAAVEVYRGQHGGRLKRIRRLSLLSSVVSIIGSPLFVLYGDSAMPLVGQLGIAASVISLSVGSTVFLQTVCYPYVTSIFLMTPPSSDSSLGLGTQDKYLRVTRLNLLGNDRVTELNRGQAQRSAGGAFKHPFSTFQFGGSNYYVTASKVTDPDIRRELCGDPPPAEDPAVEK
jgi:hypothetical protein